MPSGVEKIDYSADYLGSLKDFSSLFIGIRNKVYYFSLILIIFFIFMRRKFHFRRLTNLLLIYAVSMNLLFIFLSILDLYPWNPSSHHNLSVCVVTYFCLLITFADYITSKNKIFINIISLLCGFMLIFICVYKSSRRYLNVSDIYPEELFYSSNKIYTDRTAFPIIRYLFEYGIYKEIADEIGYPEKFTFEKGFKHNLGINTKKYFNALGSMDDLIEYNLLIVPEFSISDVNSNISLWEKYNDYGLFVRKNNLKQKSFEK